MDDLIKSVVFRPLDKGMRTNIPSQGLASGGVNIKNFHITTNGLKTRSGIRPIRDNTPFAQIPQFIDGEQVLGVEPFWSVDGAKSTIAITSGRTYVSQNLSDWAEIKWARSYEISSVNAEAKTVTIPTSTYDFDDDASGDRVKVGMYAELTNGSSYSRHLISNVTSGVITLDTWPAFTPSTGAGKLSIYRYLGANAPYVVQWVNTPVGIFLVDATDHGVLKIAESSLGSGVFMTEHLCHDGVNTNTRVFSGGVSVAYVSGHLVIGGPYEYSGRQMVRWSLISDLGYFDPRDYIDCTQTNGSVVAVSSIEDYPVVFLGDSIYIGQPYSVSSEDASAWVFRPVDCGGQAPVGPRAFARVPNGLMYLGRSDFYILTPLKRNEKGDFVSEPLRCAVLNNFYKYNSNSNQTFISWNSDEQALMASVPNNSDGYFSQIVFFYAKTQEWSYQEYNKSFTSLQNTFLATSDSWSDYDAIPWSGVGDLTWAGTMSGFENSKLTMVSDDNIIYLVSNDIGFDSVVNGGVLEQQNISYIYETGDIDFDEPDKYKSGYKVSMRIGGRVYAHENPVNFLTFVSTDNGNSWKQIGIISIQADRYENELHYRVIGTNHRYKFILSSNEAPFDIEEVTYRIKLSGQQIVRGGL